MEIEDFIKIGLMVVVVPLFFWLRVRSINKRKRSATVRCPHCFLDQRIDILRNYSCKKCGKEVRFFNDQGQRLEELATYQCTACEEQNMVGVLTCQACGLANPQVVSSGSD